MLALLLAVALQKQHASFVWTERPRPPIVEPPPPSQADHWFGSQLCGLGDVNGDRVPDVLALASGNGSRARTRALLFSGKDGADLGEVDLYSDLPMGFVEELGIGTPVRLGDLDGDGSDDFGVRRSDWHWRVESWFTAYSSRRLTPLWSLQAALDSSRFTASAHAVEDEDRDGVRDVYLSGAPIECGDGRGTLATIVSGRDGRVLRTLPAFRTERSYHERECPIGDVDGDGLTDTALTIAGSARGNVHLKVTLSAHFPAMRELAVVDFAAPFDNWSLLDVGDIDGDGLHDIGICETDSGIRIYSPCNGKLLFEDRREHWWEWSGFGCALAAFADVEGRTFILVGIRDGGFFSGAVECFALADKSIVFHRGAQDDNDVWHYGSRIEVLGDVDSDGTPDFLAAADHSCNNSPGLFQLSSGKDGHALWTAVSTATGIRVTR